MEVCISILSTFKITFPPSVEVLLKGYEPPSPVEHDFDFLSLHSNDLVNRKWTFPNEVVNTYIHSFET